jgi:regulatory protein
MDDFEKNYNRALRFLSFRPRSVKELKDYFNKKKVSKIIQERIIDKLSEYKFLNDEEFALWWIEQRTKIKQKSQRVIKRELIEKGIDKELIEKVFSENDFISDFQIAYTLAQKRFRKYKDLDQRKLFEKMGRYLASKGFNYDTIKEVIGKIYQK